MQSRVCKLLRNAAPRHTTTTCRWMSSLRSGPLLPIGECYTATLRTAQRLQSSGTPSSAADGLSAAAQASTARRSGTESMTSGEAALAEAQAHLLTTARSLLDNRRVLYRDRELLNALQPRRDAIRSLLLSRLPPVSAGTSSDTSLTPALIQDLHEAWIVGGTDADFPVSTEGLCAAIISSDLVRSDADIRLTLAELFDGEGVKRAGPHVFESILLSLPAVCAESARPSSTSSSNDGPASPVGLVLGQVRTIRRAQMGDLCGFYMGAALRHRGASPVTRSPTESRSGCHDGSKRCSSADAWANLWGTFFTVTALAQAAPDLMDLWWKQMSDFCASTDAHVTDAATPLPFVAVHAALSWSASVRDLERTLRFFHDANRRGLDVASMDLQGDGARAFFARPGCLTRRAEEATVQLAQLRILAKLMETAKSVKHDGGLRALVVGDLQRLISGEVLMVQAPWDVVNDLLGGLSMPSAMQLVRACSRARGGAGSGGDGSRTGDDGDVPFAVWASLLRRCAHEHHQDEATALFLFIRRRFRLTAAEKRELVEIVLRMHAAMKDFASAMDTFLTHVIRTPEGEPVVEPDGALYNILIKAADSRNTGMMVFLEACASGAGMDSKTFEQLLASSSTTSVAVLGRRLPYDYTSSPLDAQLRIPSDADAHVRREEALAARGKPLFPSTGESG